MKIRSNLISTIVVLSFLTEGRAMKNLNETKWKQLLEYAGCGSGGFYLGQGICLEEGYYRGEAPNTTYMDVHYSFNQMHVVDVDDEKNTITFEFMVSMNWKDLRIKANFSGFDKEKDIKESLASERIWKPNPMIHRIADSQDYEDSINVVKYALSSRGTDGSNSFNVILKLSARISVYCNPWPLETYPLDDQLCTIIFSNPGKSVLNFIVGNRKSETGNTKSEANHSMMTHYDAAGFEISTKFPNSSMENQIDVEIHMQRLFQPFFFKFYMPSILIVCISGTGFLFPLNVLPGRISLEVTQFLTLANLFIYQMVRSILMINQI